MDCIFKLIYLEKTSSKFSRYRAVETNSVPSITMTILKWRPNLLTYPFGTTGIHSCHSMVTKFNQCYWMVTEFNHHMIMMIKNLLIADVGGDRKFFCHHASMVTERFSVAIVTWRPKGFWPPQYFSPPPISPPPSPHFFPFFASPP